MDKEQTALALWIQVWAPSALDLLPGPASTAHTQPARLNMQLPLYSLLLVG